MLPPPPRFCGGDERRETRRHSFIRDFASSRSSPANIQVSKQVGNLAIMIWATFKKLTVVAAITIATAAAASSKENLLRVGTSEPMNVQVHSGLSRDDFVSYPDASYVAVHFSNFNLPEGDLVIVRSPNSEVAHFYTGKGRDDRGDFIASFISGDTAVVQYFSASGASSSSSLSSVAYTISGFSRGFPSKQDESICGNDDSVPAKCFANGSSLFDSLPEAYQKSRSVARLFINGEWLCTGWLAGSEGHLITNHHCITEASEAAVIDVEFDAESASCADQCKVQFGCAGKIAATTSTLITNNEEFDYALIKLPVSADVSAYSYLQLRAAGPALNEQIYIPQHPAGYAKRVSSVVDGGKNATIVSLHATSGCGSNEVFYAADTQGGSSGSPVLAVSDNKVVALRHCGFGCVGNTAVDITDVIADLAKKTITVANLIAA